MIVYFLYGSGMYVCTQIIHMEETGMTQQTIGIQPSTRLGSSMTRKVALKRNLLQQRSTSTLVLFYRYAPPQNELKRFNLFKNPCNGWFSVEICKYKYKYMTCYKFERSNWLKLQHSDWRANLVKDFFKINFPPMRALKIITGHVIYNPAYTYNLKTTED